MANQFVSCFRLQQPRNYKCVKVASCGERSGTNSSIPRRDSDSSYRAGKLVHKISATDHSMEENRAGKSKKSSDEWMKIRQRQGVKQHSSPAFRLMRFWFFRSSVHYLLKKVKALQINSNGSSGKVAKHSSFEMEISCVDAYFSIPVVPATMTASSSSFISS